MYQRDFRDTVGHQPTHMMGEVFPRKYRRESKSVEGCEKELLIAKRGTYFGLIRARLLEPSPEYPDPMVSLSLSAGAKHTFCQVSPKEFNDIADTLKAWADNFMGALPALETKATVYKVAQANRESQLALIQSILGQDGAADMDEAQLLKMAGLLGKIQGGQQNGSGS